MVNFTLEKINLQSLWRGYPDPNYSWDGDVLSYERLVKDEDGKDVLVKTYKDPFEITTIFEVGTEIYGIEGDIEKNVVEKFGGALKDFVWVDGVSGGGTVTLPFTAPHIFVATGERLNPTLTEIGTDSNDDNYYEIIDGKTHIHVKGFSGVGAAAGSPPTLIAHYKMNENTASDNDELVTNGDFVAWTLDNPDGWTVIGESGADPMINEVGTGQGQGGAGTGYCNIYTSDGTAISIYQDLTLIVGRKYKLSYNIDTVTAGKIRVEELAHTMWPAESHNITGIKTAFFVATHTDIRIEFSEQTGATDVTFDDVSIKLLAVEDSSGNDHDGLLQEDTSAASVAGKINTAFDFDGVADYIEIADHADFTPALTLFSISAWVYMHDASLFMIASKGIYNTDAEWQFYLDGSRRPNFRLFDESVDNCYVGRRYNTSLLSRQNEWLHLVGVYDGGDTVSAFKIYLNGIRVDDTNVVLGVFVAAENLTGPVWIGRYDTSYANGLIDNVAFFSKELTPDEVKRLYNNGHSTEILAEVDSVISPRRSTTSPLSRRMRWEFP